MEYMSDLQQEIYSRFEGKLNLINMRLLESYNLVIALIIALFGAQDIAKGGKFLILWLLFLPMPIYFLIKVGANLRNRFFRKGGNEK